MIGQYLFMVFIFLLIVLIFIARLSRNKPIAKKNKVLIFYYKIEKYLGLIFLVLFLTGIIIGIYQFYKLDNGYININKNKKLSDIHNYPNKVVTINFKDFQKNLYLENMDLLILK